MMLSCASCLEMAEILSTDINIIKRRTLSDVVKFSLFVNIGTFSAQIALLQIVSKFRTFSDCACLQ